MRYFPIFLAAMVPLVASAQPPGGQDSVEAQTTIREKETAPFPKEEKVNEILTETISFSGIAIEAMKIENPLELINPAASLEYGAAEQNVIRDPITKKVSGLKIFSIEF